MEQAKVRSITEQYLQTQGCHILESTPTYIKTQLSIEADKDLLNRPLYWMYVEKMSLPPQPARFCFLFDEKVQLDGERGEHLFFGSPRFTQILHSAQKKGRFVRLYQQPTGWQRDSTSKPYYPWLAINYRVSYICDKKKEQLRYLGINLYNGDLYEPFYPTIRHLNWTPKLPPRRHLLEARLTLAEAVGEAEYYLQESLEQEDAAWATEAAKRLKYEWEQLDAYYPEPSKRSPEENEEWKQRRYELAWQYQPRIEVDVANAGLFYMETASLDHLKH